MLTANRLAWRTFLQYWPNKRPAAAEGPIPTQSLFETLVAGGPLMIPILLASFVMLLIVFERMISLRRRRVVPRLFIERFLLQLRENALDRSEALERCEDESSHIARVFAAGRPQMGQAGRRSGAGRAR